MSDADMNDQPGGGVGRSGDPVGDPAEVAGQLFRLDRLMAKFHARMIVGVTPWGDSSRGQGRVLAALKLQPRIAQKDLAFLLDMSKQALGELLGKLEQKGFVKRAPSEEDRRVTIVTLTPAGAKVAEGGSECHHSTEIEGLLDAFTDEELIQFSGYLQRLIDGLEAAGGFFGGDFRKQFMEHFVNAHDGDVRAARHAFVNDLREQMNALRDAMRGAGARGGRP